MAKASKKKPAKAAKAEAVKAEDANKEEPKTESTSGEAKQARGTKSATKKESGKRARSEEPKPDEYVEDKEEVWRNVFLVGTEWDQLDDVYAKYKWNFDHLDEALEEGELSANDSQRGNESVYLFGTTEPQLIQVHEDETKPKLVVPVPVIVAIRSAVRPPEMLGIKSVQMEKESIVPMKQFKMGWVEQFEPTRDPSKKKRQKSASSPSLDLDHWCPHIFFPHKAETEDATADTVVNVVRTIDGKGLVFDYDWEMDELDDFTKEIMESHELPPASMDEVRDAIREEVKAAKQRIKEEKEARKKKIEAFSPEEREALKNIKLLKFYPTNKIPDVSQVKSTYINRYYGHAQKVL
eukprot:tig00000704_g3324.t1